MLRWAVIPFIAAVLAAVFNDLGIQVHITFRTDNPYVVNQVFGDDRYIAHAQHITVITIGKGAFFRVDIKIVHAPDQRIFTVGNIGTGQINILVTDNGVVVGEVAFSIQMNFTAAFQGGVNLQITRGINDEFILGVDCPGVITVINVVIRVAVGNIPKGEITLDIQLQRMI